MRKYIRSITLILKRYKIELKRLLRNSIWILCWRRLNKKQRRLKGTQMQRRLFKMLQEEDGLNNIY